MAVNAAYAALFEPGVAKLQLEHLPLSQAQGPDYLNVLKFTDLPWILGGTLMRLSYNPSLLGEGH
jgi:hypothetical protein